MKHKVKLTILHNIISPYRLPLFEELSKIYDLTVLFCQAKTKDRLWSTSLENYAFKYKILPSFNIGPIVINFSLFKELLNNKSEVLLLVENPENVISILTLLFIAKIFKSKIILWSERIDDEILTPVPFKIIVKYIYKIYRKFLYSISDVLIPLSNAAEFYLKQEGLPGGKIKKSYQIMPECTLAKPTNKFKPKFLKNKTVIFSLGRLVFGKGIDNLINAFNNLNRKDALLLIAGNGDYESNLKKLAKNNKNIHFLGYVDGVSKANYYSSSDFFVFPTHYDVWGFVVNEALYYGLPVIVSDKACASELIINGKTGFIFKDNNTEELTLRMKELLNNKRLLAKMKKRVKEISKKKFVDTDALVDSFENAINYSLK